MQAWQSALSFLVLSAVVGVSMLVGAWALRVKARRQSPLKRLTYECGEEPEGVAWIKFHPRYYVVALVFVLFDVEAAFLFPWAVSLRDVGALAIWEMLIFVGILLLGWVYALRKGALKWQ
ncbi:MAG: NADH-quinone oxidoreductase subunit A [Polyangiaceae bacterium]